MRQPITPSVSDAKRICVLIDPCITQYLQSIDESGQVSFFQEALKVGIGVLRSKSPTVQLIAHQILDGNSEVHHG